MFWKLWRGSFGCFLGICFLMGFLFWLGFFKFFIELEFELEIEGLLILVLEVGDVDEGIVVRFFSFMRLQLVLLLEVQLVFELEEVVWVLVEIFWFFKCRGFMEQVFVVVLFFIYKKQYQQIISCFFYCYGGLGFGGLELELFIIIEGFEVRVGFFVFVLLVFILFLVLFQSSLLEQLQSMEMCFVLWKVGFLCKVCCVCFNFLVFFLDVVLIGELEVVQQVVKEINDLSQFNEEGIIVLYNVICGVNYFIVDFFIIMGVNVNFFDSYGWIFLYCVVLCNDIVICMVLVQYGVVIFVIMFSDGVIVFEKCDFYCEGYVDCVIYLVDVEQSMGLMNSGVVYVFWDYSVEFGDELFFCEGELVIVLWRDGLEEIDWWWVVLYGQEGYVLWNYFGFFFRVKF